MMIIKKSTLFILMIPFLSFSQWNQIGQEIFGENEGSQSGSSVSLNADGSIVAIGAWLDEEDGVTSGQVRVYKNQSGTWVQLGSDFNGIVNDEQFGLSLSLNSSGNILAIGARQGYSAIGYTGYAQVFEYTLGNWVQIGSNIDGENINDSFGRTISLSDDGNIVAISALQSQVINGVVNIGHVSVFENINDSWVQIGNNINGEADRDSFGQSISLSSDGSILAIGAPGNDGNGENSGHVRVFKNINGNWSQIGFNLDGEASEDSSGKAVSLSDDGSIVAIGANLNDGNGNTSGHVRVFENISDQWVQLGSDLDGEFSGSILGTNVYLSGDGTKLATNSRNENNIGFVALYENISGVWTKTSNNIGIGNDYDVSIDKFSFSNDGNTIVITDRFDNNASGSATVFSPSTLSTVENHLKPNFLIHPNPCSDYTIISSNNIYDEVSISIYDILGKKIETKHFLSTNEVRLNTEKYFSGYYIIKIQSNQMQTTKKLVKY